jgi:hypothetical protein
MRKFSLQTLRKRRLRKTFSYLALEMRQLKLRAGLYLMMLLANSGQRVTSMNDCFGLLNY